MTAKTYTLRPYQQEAVAACFDALIGDAKSMIITLPTGTGKTIMVADIVQKFVEEFGYRVLFLAHRRELILQNYTKVRDYTGLEEYIDIDVEMGQSKFNPHARVIIGSVQTCKNPNRLQGFTPNVIITDECHCAPAPSYRSIYARFPQAYHIGITATAQRSDRKTLFAEDLQGAKVKVLDIEANQPRDLEPEEYVFERHIYDYPLLKAIEEGWLVNIRAWPVKSGLDISKVRVSRSLDGERDFAAKELSAVLEQDERVIVHRINKGISAWKQVASDRPTVVFCPSVKYAHWAADLWRQAGYKAQTIDSDTPLAQRDLAIERIKTGEVQVTCNFGIFTHGTDVPKWSCVVMLRPMNSWGLYCQCIGRGTRPAERIAGRLSRLASAEERVGLIAGSEKKDCVVIDVVDVCSKHDLCTAPSILGLPSTLDMQGKTLTEAKGLIDRFEGVKHKVIGECPATYEELSVRLQEANLLLGSKAKTTGSWAVAEDGSYRYSKCPVGYSAHLSKTSVQDGVELWTLTIKDDKRKAIVLEETAARRNGPLKAYFDSAAKRAVSAMRKHREENTAGTLSTLSSKQVYTLMSRGRMTREEIDRMPLYLAKIKIGSILRRERAGG